MTIDERPVVARDRLRMEAERGMEELIGSTVFLRRQLVTQEAVCRKVLSDVQDDVPVGCLLQEVHTDTWRPALTEAIKGFEIVRHRVRLVLVAMAIDEGMSIADIAKHWGVSRQLASRWVQECVAARE